jgi:hypothetical protein
MTDDLPPNGGQPTRGAMERLGKLRVLLAGWQLGTRPKGDPESDAVRDHREATLILRAEVTALTGLLIAKGIVTEDEIGAAFEDEAERLIAAYERRFPGVTVTDYGLKLDKRVQAWMKGWKP